MTDDEPLIWDGCDLCGSAEMQVDRDVDERKVVWDEMKVVGDDEGAAAKRIRRSSIPP